MVTRSDHCPRSAARVQGGEGIVHIKDLTDREGLYGHGKMFSHIVVNPGCSIGYHDHQHETEFYYILRGEAVFNDDGTEVPVHPGDICATGFGQHHALENRGKEPVELIALIVTE